MTQLSNVPTQPNPSAVERPLTLIEKLEQARDNHNYYLETCGNDRDKAYHSFGKKCYQEAIAIVKQHSQETCNWRNNKGTGLWECHYGGDYTSDCGLEWNMSNKDSPNENEMHFCPKCGKKLVEVQSPSEVKE